MKNSKDNYKKDLEEIDKRMEEIDKLVKEADEFENVDFESFEYRTEKENAIYEKTKEFGRTQFVREISFQIIENKKLKEERETNINFISELQNDLYKITMKNQELTAKIDKAIEYMNGEEFFLLMNSIQTPDKAVCEDYFKAKGILLEILKDSDVDEKTI